jgi:hypothetical protein
MPEDLLQRRLSYRSFCKQYLAMACRLQTFALSAVECAGVLDAADARQEWSAYHDPNKNSAGEGTTRKQLAWVSRPAHVAPGACLRSWLMRSCRHAAHNSEAIPCANAVCARPPTEDGSSP